MKSYFEMPEATAAAIDSDGWYHTGDLASMDERGYCRVEGRLKDMIIRGGENIYPREIEEVLFSHPGVAEVAVVGIPDAKWGEVVGACVRLAPGQTPGKEELVAYCRQHLAPFKTPQHWMFVETFPLTPSGKIQKFVLRDRFASEQRSGPEVRSQEKMAEAANDEVSYKRSSVICIGAVAPATWTYARLQRLLHEEAHLVLKDLAGYAEPLAVDYGLQSEVESITRAADVAGFHRFHLVGYSAGGGVALAFALAYPERVSSLTLIEPAWIGNHAWDSVEIAYLSTVDRAMQLPVSQSGHALLAAMSPPGTDPSTIPTPDWLMERSARFEPIWRGFREATLDIKALQSFSAPVYLPVGGQSHPRFILAAHRLASLCPRSWVDIYQDQNHLETPPIRETERFIRAARTLWADSAQGDKDDIADFTLMDLDL